MYELRVTYQNFVIRHWLQAYEEEVAKAEEKTDDESDDDSEDGEDDADKDASCSDDKADKAGVLN